MNKIDRILDSSELEFLDTEDLVVGLEFSKSTFMADSRITDIAAAAEIQRHYPKIKLTALVNDQTEPQQMNEILASGIFKFLQWPYNACPSHAELKQYKNNGMGLILCDFPFEHDDSAGFMDYFLSYRSLVDFFQIEILPEYGKSAWDHVISKDPALFEMGETELATELKQWPSIVSLSWDARSYRQFNEKFGKGVRAAFTISSLENERNLKHSNTLAQVRSLLSS